MQRRRGFTIVELIIVIVIIAILLSLSALLLFNNQANGRDAKRKADIENIARGLETRYKEGNPEVSAPSYVSAGSYPGVNEMQHIMGTSVAGFTPAQISGGYSDSALPGTSVSSFSPPGVTAGTYSGFLLTCTSSCSTALTAASLGASLTISTYYYQPIDASGNVCMQGDCVRFQLFWKSEADNVTHTVESKHQ